MDKYIGFDIDTAKTAVCVIQNGKKEKFYTLGSDVEGMIKYALKWTRLSCHDFDDNQWPNSCFCYYRG